VSFPGNTEVQDAFIDYWKDKGQDVSIFVEAAQDPAPADTGAKANAGLTAALPVFQEIFAGRKTAEEGLPEAQDAGNEAMK
jgi:multiple sugar transport system substrate-binding protein